MRSVCVFCGSSQGSDPAFAAAAERLGTTLASTARTLIYGGGHVGLMGIVADAALNAGGTVIGVIPRSLAEQEIAHRGLSELHVVESMHERKALMAELSDGFIVLPGGIGTLEEFFEVWTWGQLGVHIKPFGILEVSDFFQPLLLFLDRLVERRFVRHEHRDMLLVSRDPVELLSRLESHRTPLIPKWLDRQSL